MAFTEMPPMLSGSTQQQLNALRDYLFRMAKSLEPVTQMAENKVIYDKTGRVQQETGTAANSEAIEKVRKNAAELEALIIKSADNLTQDIAAAESRSYSYADSKTEEYNSMYVARSEYGDFVENIETTITNTARGVVESYDYGAAIESVQDDIGLIQNYYTAINGEIRRGIIEDPDNPGTYVTGVAISQNLQFSGECGPTDANNPGDGFTYYYLNEGQTFGLYTSTGWQFWIDGVKVGWFNSQDGMLHVANVYIEDTLQLGDWKIIRSGLTLRIERDVT